MQEILNNLGAWVWQAGIVIASVFVGLILHLILFRILQKLTARTESILDDSMVKNFRRPAQLIIPLMTIWLSLPLIGFSPSSLVFIKHLLSVLLIVSVSWLLIKVSHVIGDVVLYRYRLDVKDNLKARKIHTQLKVLNRIVVLVVTLIAVGAILMTFEKVRQLGVSLLASAGIIGIVVGFAAQKTLATLIAGIQIAVTQPIRIDDVVIVENEWGRIEEITLTYVVVRIWDLRRLILPITYFIEKPFQNWTRVTADLLGTAYLYVDHSVPIDELRKALHDILQASKCWDGKVWALQVTDVTERTVQLRALMSAANASDAWDLRCEVREKLVDFVKRNYPQVLPRMRVEHTAFNLSSAATASDSSA